MENQDNNTRKKESKLDSRLSTNKSIKPITQQHKDPSIPVDLIDDLNKKKIDPLTESSINLGYEERAPRKKELKQKEHLDKDDKQ